MKKILYGVSGIGNGHANRQLSIIEKLSQNNLIYILAYQDSYKTLTNKLSLNSHIKIINIAVPFIVGDQNGINFGAIGENKFNQDINFLSINSKALGIVESELGTPDLVITDYEPICAQYAYSKNIPLVTIDQQSKYLCSDLPDNINGFTYKDEVERLHMFFPKTAARIACSFFKTKQKTNSDHVIFMPPPIKEDIVSLKRHPSGKNHILVYISSARDFVQFPLEVMEVLSICKQTTFHLFVNRNEISEYQKMSSKNIILYPISDSRFIDILAFCDGIITTAGHSLLSEAMYLGIPVYAIPVAPYEQHMNAKIIGDNCFGLNVLKLIPDKIKEFVCHLSLYSKNIREDKKILIRGIGQDLIVDYLKNNFLSKKKVLLFSPPFNGHLNVLKEFIKDNKDSFDFHLVITGWENIVPDLSGINLESTTILNDGILKETDPALWTFPRVVNLLPACQKIVTQFKPDLIIYDFFSIEGNLVGRVSHIPYWCSIPAMLGPYEDKQYCQSKFLEDTNQKAISSLKKDYGISINNNEVELVSDGFHLPGLVNLVWSFPEITPSNFKKNRQDFPYVFVGNPRGDNYEKTNFNNTKPLIYISFGTVVMDNLWNNQAEVRENLKLFIEKISDMWSDRNYQIIFSTQGKKILDNYPQNWWVYDTVNQVEILSRADLFITHGGSNSFHEAVLQKVPMLVIPFFGDQILVGNITQKLGYGKKIGGSQNIDTHASKNFLNDNLISELDKSVQLLLSKNTTAINYSNLNLSFFDLNKLIKGDIQYQNGDLIVGKGINYPRSKEQLPTTIEGYFTLLKTNHQEYPTREIFNILQSLKYILGNLKGKNKKIKLIDFFSTLFTVHCLIDDNCSDVDLVKEYWQKYGGNIIFYKNIDGVWIRDSVSKRKLNKLIKIQIENKNIILASSNSIKLVAVRKALGGEQKGLNIIGFEPKASYPEQLVSIDEIVYAVVSRLKEIELNQPKSSFLISVVSGIFNKNGCWKDLALVLCRDENQNLGLSKSSTLEFPNNIVEKTKNRGFDKHTVSSVLAEEYSNHSLAANPHWLLTTKKINRETVLSEAIKLACSKIAKY